MSLADGVADGEKVSVLLFQSGGRRYGIRLAKVREVAEIEAIEPLEGRSEDYVGVMVLRDEPIPLAVVRPAGTEIPPSLPICIVLQSGAAVIGLAVERILGIRNFRPERTVAGLVAEDRPQQTYLDDDGRLIQAVDVDRWFAAQPKLPLLSDQRSARSKAESAAPSEASRTRYMALTIGDQYFAVDSRLVERAVDDASVAMLPNRPGVRLDSVIEVSGNVLPVLRLSADDLGADVIYIIVNFFDQKWAIATERVLGIVANESPARPVGDETQERVISSKGRFHEVIDLRALISAHVPDFVRPDGSRA
ncbi:MAG: chemotaxis protein CheW [Thalassobaculum sp.]|uniref:chemotaxis protein CheW n=1 Tax=Thalassobaculum sp. TaxID=2022740 RepID=UPI0032EB2214